MDIDYIAMGEAIRFKRLDLGWKIKDLSDTSGISEDFIGKIERGTDTPSLQTVVNLANALNIGLDFLVGIDLKSEKCIDENVGYLTKNMRDEQRKQYLKFIRLNAPFFGSLNLSEE